MNIDVELIILIFLAKVGFALAVYALANLALDLWHANALKKFNL